MKSQCGHHLMSTIWLLVITKNGFRNFQWDQMGTKSPFLLPKVPISLKMRSPFGPHFEKFRSPFHVGAVPLFQTDWLLFRRGSTESTATGGPRRTRSSSRWWKSSRGPTRFPSAGGIFFGFLFWLHWHMQVSHCGEDMPWAPHYGLWPVKGKHFCYQSCAQNTLNLALLDRYCFRCTQ